METNSINGLGGVGLLPRLGDFQSDLVDYGIGGASAFAANLGWGKVEAAVAPMIPASLPAVVHQYALPVAQVAAGVVLGPMISRKGGKLKWVGAGVAIGLVGGGLLKIAKTVGVPGIAGLGAYDPVLMAGASLDVESPSRFVPSTSNFQGAQLSIEAPAKFGGIGGTPAGIASVFS